MLAGLAQPMGRNPAIFHEDGRTVWLFASPDGVSFQADEPLALEVRFHHGRPGCADSSPRVEVEQNRKRVAVVTDSLPKRSIAAGYRDFPILASGPIRIDVPAVRGGTTRLRLEGGRCGGSVTNAPPISSRTTALAVAPDPSRRARHPAASGFRSAARLIAAAKSGNLAAVAQQVDKGMPVDATDGEVDAYTALGWAAYHGHRDVAERLLERGARIDAQNRRGYSPLMAAAQGGHGEVVRLLLEKGANPNLATRNGDTALLYAAMFADAETVRALLERGARTDATNELGDTAETLAASLGRPDISRVLANAVVE